MSGTEFVRMKNGSRPVDEIALVRQLIAEGSYEQALALLRSQVAPAEDFSVQAKASRLVSKIPASALGKPVRVALLASSTLDQFSDLLKLWLAFEGFAAEIWIASFDTMHAQVLDKDSELYRFQPDVIWLFNTHRDVRIEVALGDTSGVGAAVAAARRSQAICAG